MSIQTNASNHDILYSSPDLSNGKLMSKPVPAATLCLLRASRDGFEVFLMRRRKGGTFSGLHVFPGGVVDSADNQLSHVAPIPQALAMRDRSRFLHRESVTGFWVAAIRETFEESGVLLAYDRDQRFLAGEPNVFAFERLALNNKSLDFNDFVANNGLTLATDRLSYMSRKVTPTYVPRRFDTHFFVAEVPPSTDGSPCTFELESGFWITPEQALRRSTDDIQMVRPTLKTLEALRAFSRPQAVVDFYLARWSGLATTFSHKLRCSWLEQARQRERRLRVFESCFLYAALALCGDEIVTQRGVKR